MAFGSLTGLVATVGAVAALIALFQLTLPYTPEVPTAGACPGAQTQNVDFLATTHTSGINARAGPGRTYEFVGRFQGDCSLGFVGYCLGEPVIDVFYIPDFYVPDMRWLVLPENRGYVAAAVVRAQQPESDLTLVDGCPDAVELPDSIAVSGTASKGKEALRLSAAAEWASTVGFAAYYENEGPVFVRLGLDASASDGFLAEWDPTAALSDSEEALVVGVICYAAEIPSHIHDAVRVTASNGSKSVTEGTKQWESLPALTKDRAARKACLLPEA
jgi:hypothetical protein